MGPVRESVQLAEMDARKFDEASAVSLEALQEVQRNLTSLESEGPNVVVEKRSATFLHYSFGPSDSRLVRLLHYPARHGI